MKKFLVFIILLLILLSLSNCENKKDFSVIVPSGTPSLGLANFIKDYEENVDIVLGSSPLVAAFTSENYDIVVAPINLGVKFYNSVENFNYTLYRTIVSGNYYILSTENIDSIEDLNNKEIIVFSPNATPDIMIRSLLSYYNVNAIINYVDNVSIANSMLLSNQTNIILSAEPSATVINANHDYNSFSLQEAWASMSGNNYVVPQAGIFVNNNVLCDETIERALDRMIASIDMSVNNIEQLADDAIQIDNGFANVGKEKLIIAIPRCNFVTRIVRKEEIEFYLNKLLELNMGAGIGEKLPDEEFYKNL